MKNLAPNSELVLWFLFLIAFLSPTLIQSTNDTAKSTEYSCFVQRNGAKWRLLYHDEFNENSTKIDTNRWTVEHEAKTCNGDFIRHVSCNTRDNVHVLQGFLALFAQQEPYLDKNFTAAVVTSQATFGPGRYEIRASQPLGLSMRTVMFTPHPKDAYWHENGVVDMGSNMGEQILTRGLFPSNKRATGYQPADLLTSVDLHRFHVYGVEWNLTMLHFFFDDAYSRPFPLLNGSGLNPGHQIRFQLGVGLEAFGQVMPQEFKRLKWTCPAYVIDYVRIYEKVEEGDLTGNVTENCDFKLGVEKNDEDEKLEIVCKKSMEKMEKLVKKENDKIILNGNGSIANNSTISSSSSSMADFFGSSKFAFTCSLLIIFIILIIYLIIQVKKVQKQKNISTNVVNPNGFNDDFYCSPTDYYEIPSYGAQKSLQTEYSNDLKEITKPHETITPRVSNDYVPIKE